MWMNIHEFGNGQLSAVDTMNSSYSVYDLDQVPQPSFLTENVITSRTVIRAIFEIRLKKIFKVKRGASNGSRQNYSHDSD